ncbi:hypothetical protein [Sorangium sp. So ce1389]|uniref:hypothetical protein n=1 Tax=Sorangium sp. So ce1389 TaxID=3133336 RepID=UPI003F5F675D
MLRRRRQRSPSRWARQVVRLLSALVLALVVSQSAAAYAFVVLDGCEESCPDDEDGCDCPLDCASGCCAVRVAGIPVSPSVPVLFRPSAVERLLLLAERAPPSAEAREVLHVPKPFALARR